MSRSTALRILSIAAVLGLLGQGLLVGNLFGLNLLVLAIALLGAAAAVRPAGSHLDRFDRWLPIAALAVIAGVVIRLIPCWSCWTSARAACSSAHRSRPSAAWP